MEFSYYSKLDPRRLSSPVKSDNELTNLLASDGEPLIIHFNGNTFTKRLVIRRDVTIIGSIRATFLLSGTATVKFIDSNVSPVNVKGSGDTYSTIILAGNFTGSLTIHNSIIRTTPQQTNALGMMSDTKITTLTIDNSTLEGITFASDVLTLANRVTIQSSKSGQQSILNAAYVVTNNTQLVLYNTKLMQAGPLIRIQDLTLKKAKNELHGNYEINHLTVEASDKSLEQLHILSNTYQSDVTIKGLTIAKSVKSSAAIYVSESNLTLNHAIVENKSPQSRITLRNATVDIVATQESLQWSVSGDSHINIDNESVSSLFQLVDKFPPTYRQKPLHEDTEDDVLLAQDMIKTDDLDLPSDNLDDTESKTPKKSAEDELHDLIGLQGVKDKLDQFIAKATLDAERKKRGIHSGSSINRHMVFLGNPGTGKTTVARLVAEILHERGALPTSNVVEFSADSLSSDHVGGTIKKMEEIISNADGGILFIDEAYALNESKASGTFISEAVRTLMTAAENKRDTLLVILAGYTKDMKELFETGNEGFQSRFPSSNHIEFTDYSDDERLEIFKMMLKSQQALMNESFYQTPKFKSLMSFYARDNANARSVRNLVEALVLERDTRLNNETDIRKLTNEMMVTITAKDIVAVYNKAVETKKREDSIKLQYVDMDYEFENDRYGNYDDIARAFEED